MEVAAFAECFLGEPGSQPVAAQVLREALVRFHGQLSPVLRAVALPGAELVLPLLVSKPLVTAGATLGRGLSRFGLRIGSGIAEMATGFASLQEAQSRRAFVHTARSVIDSGGQRVDATDKLYLAHDVPTLLVWGDRDPVIPARHGIRAHGNWPGSRLQIFEGAGHFPHQDDPLAFSELIRDFVATTEPSKPDDDRLRRLVVARRAAQNEPSSARFRRRAASLAHARCWLGRRGANPLGMGRVNGIDTSRPLFDRKMVY